MPKRSIARCASPRGSPRWERVTVWWRIQMPGHPIVLRKVEGPLDADLLQNLSAQRGEAYLGEAKVVCATSGRVAITSLSPFCDGRASRG